MKKNIINLPFKAVVADYEECCEKIKEEASRNDSVVAVYLLGGKWVPGISDIDIVVVYKNILKPMRSPWEISGTARRIFSHRYLSFSQEDFEKYFYTLYPKETTSIKLLGGKDITIDDPKQILGDVVYKEMLLVTVVDVLVNKLLLPPIFGSLGEGESTDILRMLGILHSISYTETLVSTALGVEISKAGKSFVTELRDGWSERSLPENISLLEKAQKDGEERVLFLLKQLADHFESCGGVGRAATFSNKQYRINYKTDWKINDFKKSFTTKTIKFPFRQKKLHRTSFSLPVSLSPVLTGYGEFPGPWSVLVRSALSGRGLSESPSPGVVHRAKAINTVFEHTIETNDFYRAPFLYGFSLFEVRHPVLARLIVKMLFII